LGVGQPRDSGLNGRASTSGIAHFIFPLRPKRPLDAGTGTDRFGKGAGMPAAVLLALAPQIDDQGSDNLADEAAANLARG
jgi:hypothetical protein